MHGIWLQKGQLAFHQGLPHPQPRDGEALIRVYLAGICGTDLNLKRGYYDFTGIPGHEFVGVVEEAPGADNWTGCRVVGDINLSCGHCAQCQANRPKHCLRRKVVGIAGHQGAFAEFISLPLDNLVRVPDAVADEKAVFAEPLAAAVHAVQTARPVQGDNILVIGAGRLGQLIARALVAAGHMPAIAPRYPAQHRMLQNAGIDPIREEDIRPNGYDIVIEASGNPATLPLALTWVRAGGHVVLKSTYAYVVNFDFSRLVVDEVKISGSRCGDVEQAINMLANYEIDPEPLVDSVFRLDKAAEAFERAAQGGAMKVLFDLRRQA